MTKMEFFGCAFIAFGAPVALFIFTIARDPLRVIVLMASAFFWLVALLLSSILWYAVVPLRETLVFGVVFSVIFQEAFRLLFYIILRKADEGLKKVSERESTDLSITLVHNRHLMAYVSGLGFGLTSGAFSLVNILADMTGPGTIGLYGHHEMLFITSAFLTLCFIFLHTAWGIVFFDGIYKKRWWQPLLVVLSHEAVSCVTLLNQRNSPLYSVTITFSYVMLALMTGWAFLVAGGSWRRVKAFLTNSRQSSYNVD